MQTTPEDLKRLYRMANMRETVTVIGGLICHPNDEDRANALALRRAADDIKVALAAQPALTSANPKEDAK